MSDRDNASKWQRVADLIAELGLVSGQPEPIRTAAQVDRMSTRQLLQDPVRARIYYRGWADRTADIQRSLRNQPPNKPTPSPSRKPAGNKAPVQKPIPPPASKTTGERSSVTSREPAPVPGPSRTAPTPVVRVRTEAQQARLKRKFQQLKEKRKARECNVSQQSRLAKLPKPYSDLEAASGPPPEPTPSGAMEVDQPAPKGTEPEEQAPATSQDRPCPGSEDFLEDIWLAAPGPSLEGPPEVVFDNKSFFTPVGSPNRP